MRKRSYGNGSLYRKRGSKVWQIRYRGPKTAVTLVALKM